MLLSLWWLAGRDVLLALALIAFPPVAVEFWYRNIHLILAVLIVLAIRGIPALYSVGALIKFSPGLGIPFLLAPNPVARRCDCRVHGRGAAGHQRGPIA